MAFIYCEKQVGTAKAHTCFVCDNDSVSDFVLDIQSEWTITSIEYEDIV